MSYPVRNDGSKVWIDGAKGFHPGEFASTPHGCQARICEAIGEGPTYDDLICYGGFAFRANWHESQCPSAGHPCCGYMCIDNSNLSLPWRVTVYGGDRTKVEADVCAAVQRSIDRGVPLHYGSEEDGLIVGYADSGKRWLCVHPYHHRGAETFWHDEANGFAGGKWPWFVVEWTTPVPWPERPTKDALFLAALKQAIDMWHTEKRDAYFCGDAAYTHWLKWLKDVESGQIADPKSGMQGNGWCFDVLIHSRRVAARWLRSRAEQYEDEIRRQLLVAADHYAKLVERCTKDLSCPWDLTPKPGQAERWTSAMRLEQIDRLEQSHWRDGQAIRALEASIPLLAPAEQLETRDKG